MSLAPLLKAQLGYKSLIERTYANFKKTPKDRLIKESHLLTRIESLEEKWKVFSDTHMRLITEISTEELAETRYISKNMYECVEELYIECKAEIRECLSQLKPSKSSRESQASDHNSKSESINVRLPKISIPTFTGSYSEWTTFKDLYESLVHNNAAINDVQKMHYLKGHLSGEAEQLLRHVPITAADYQESWLKLNNRYNNKRYLANCLLRRFVNQPSLGSESSSALKDILDVTNDTLNGLKNLGIDVGTWDTIVIFTICSKLDSESRKEWESKISSTEDLPTLSQMREFLESRFRSLEFLDPKQKPKPSFSNHRTKVMHAMTDRSEAVVKMWCSHCKSSEHKMPNCKEFIKLDYDQRHSFVQTSRLCFNCLGSNHSATICRSPVRCRVCHRKHHSLLHPKPSESIKSNLAAEITETVSRVKTSLDDPGQTSKFTSHFSKGISSRKVLLATALVEAEARDGSKHTLRALLDHGSEASFVTESAAQLLGLKRIHSRSSISGLGGEKEETLASKYVIMMNIHSRHEAKFQVRAQAHVLSTITSLLPAQKINHVEWPEFAEIALADPQFHTPSKIDILLGADVFSELIRDGLIKGPKGMPTAQRTALGWIISGPTHETDNNQNHSPQCHHSVVSMNAQVENNALLKKVREKEHSVPEREMEEQRCKEIYKQPTTRDESGQYIVSLPFQSDSSSCLHSRCRDLAVGRFQHLERKFEREQEIKKQYSETILGVSSNEELLVGPRLQPPLRHIITRWRMYPTSFSGDVVKMYRQVKMSPEHADFQRVVWRDDSASETEEYRLLRVMFGTASAPYLAVTSLKQIADDEGSQYPGVFEIIKNDFLDDLMTGCQSVVEGVKLHNDIKSVLTKGGFDLQKCVSSCKKLNRKISSKIINEKGLVDVERYSVAPEIQEWLGNKSVSWQFILPHPSNIGGPWEPGVISTKFELRRVIGETTVTCEELSTILCRVESCLNSRPLSVMPDSPLTPGHLLIGEPLTSIPDYSYEDVNVGSFWRKWSQEYLEQVLQRYKCNKHILEPNIRDIILVKEGNLPPAQWLLGKVTAKHPGLDKVYRVVTVKCNRLFINTCI